MLKKKFWNIYLFSVNDKHFCYNCITNKIYQLSSDLFFNINNKNIKRTYNTFYKILKTKDQKYSPSASPTKCIVTLNFSNTCNLHCSYCYRNKNENKKMSKEEIENIIKFIKYEYMPEANEYVFSLCYTSESSFDLDYLVFFDSLIAKYEGYLFENNDFIYFSPKEIFKILPSSILNKYNIEKGNDIDILNKILMNEKLWLYFDFSYDNYLKDLISFTSIISLSKTVTINRQLLNHYFTKYNINKTIKYMSMSFMTNATNITNAYINFIKSIYMKEIYVSIDGPENEHNSSRKFLDGKGSFSRTIEGIKKLQAAGIEVYTSSVLTPDNHDFHKIVHFLISYNIKKIGYSIARTDASTQNYSKYYIDNILVGIDKLYDEILEELQKSSNKILSVVKRNPFILLVFDIYSHSKRLYRCNWGKEMVIDANGNIYHCNSTIGNKKDFLGNWNEKPKKEEIFQLQNVNTFKRCKKCFAKYLCGGICYAEILNKHEKNIELECYYKKNLIKKACIFFVKLQQNNLLDLFINEVKP